MRASGVLGPAGARGTVIVLDTPAGPVDISIAVSADGCRGVMRLGDIKVAWLVALGGAGVPVQPLVVGGMIERFVILIRFASGGLELS